MMPLRLQADPVEARDQRLQVGAADDGELAALLIGGDEGLRRDDRLARARTAAAGRPWASR